MLLSNFKDFSHLNQSIIFLFKILLGYKCIHKKKPTLNYPEKKIRQLPENRANTYCHLPEILAGRFIIRYHFTTLDCPFSSAPQLLHPLGGHCHFHRHLLFSRSGWRVINNLWGLSLMLREWGRGSVAENPRNMNCSLRSKRESWKQLKQWQMRIRDLLALKTCSWEALCTACGGRQWGGRGSFYASGSLWKSRYFKSPQTDSIDVSFYAWQDLVLGKADSSRSKYCLQLILSTAHSTPVAHSWGFARFVNIRDGSAATPLHLAALQGRPECVRILLSSGALVCAIAGFGGYSYQGSTPLHLAARSGSLDCVRELLAWGADRLQRDSFGRIPFMVAMKYKHKACAALLNPSAPEPLTWPSRLKFISELNPEAKALLEKALIVANKEREKAILKETSNSLLPPSNFGSIDDDFGACDVELCCICFEQVCTIEVQKCGHQMCAHCILALCCHNKPNPATNCSVPVCPFCRSTITQLAVAKSKTNSDVELEFSPMKTKRTRKSLNLSEGSSSFKSFVTLEFTWEIGPWFGKGCC
ncbi:Uncharacterized protein Fot_33068 [Forsythia ovata]|uniref:RING-type E3 ubiquitin transferase n=1 Tax=Forsythia ovata TaxID=205694 RepID=A0ABD1T9L6_9LAMI